MSRGSFWRSASMVTTTAPRAPGSRRRGRRSARRSGAAGGPGPGIRRGQRARAAGGAVGGAVVHEEDLEGAASGARAATSSSVAGLDVGLLVVRRDDDREGAGPTRGPCVLAPSVPRPARSGAGSPRNPWARVHGEDPRRRPWRADLPRSVGGSDWPRRQPGRARRGAAGPPPRRRRPSPGGSRAPARSRTGSAGGPGCIIGGRVPGHVEGELAGDLVAVGEEEGPGGVGHRAPDPVDRAASSRQPRSRLWGRGGPGCPGGR